MPLEIANRYLLRLLDLSLGIFFISCVLGSATGLRNVSLIALVLISLATKSWAILLDKRLKFFTISVLFFLLSNIPGAFFSDNFSGFFSLSKEYLIVLLLMGLGARVGADPAFWQRALRWQIAAITILAILSIGIIWVNVVPGREAYVITHWYPWYGIATTLAVLMVPLCFLYFDPEIKSGNKVGLVFLGFCLLVVLTAAVNRASFVVVLFLILYFCLRFFDSYKTKIALFSVALIVSLSGFLYQANQRLSSDESERYSIAHSLDVIKKTFVNDSRIAGWNFWIEKSERQMPWYGFGIEKKSMKKLLSTAEIEDPRLAATALVSHSHNVFLNTFLRSGFVGLMIFLLIWLLLYKQLGDSCTEGGKGSSAKLTSTVARAVLIAMFLKNITDDFFEPPMIYLFFLWLGLLWGRIHGGEVALRKPFFA